MVVLTGSPLSLGVRLHIKSHPKSYNLPTTLYVMYKLTKFYLVLLLEVNCHCLLLLVDWHFACSRVHESTKVPRYWSVKVTCWPPLHHCRCHHCHSPQSKNTTVNIWTLNFLIYLWVKRRHQKLEEAINNTWKFFRLSLRLNIKYFNMIIYWIICGDLKIKV